MPTTMLTTSKMLIVVKKHKCCLHFYKKKSNTVLLPSQIMLQQEPLSKQFVRYRGLQAGLWGVINYFYHCHIFSYGPFLFLSILNINTINALPYDTVSDVVESKVHQCQQNSDAQQDGLILPQEISF